MAAVRLGVRNFQVSKKFKNLDVLEEENLYRLNVSQKHSHTIVLSRLKKKLSMNGGCLV